MKKAGKVLGLLLAGLLIVGILPAGIGGAQKAEAAATPVFTHDMEQIKQLLKEDGDAHIVLDGDAEETIKGYASTGFMWVGDYWCELGAGEKILDLNGYHFTVHLDEARKTGMYEQTVTMFHVTEGTRFVINDRSGKNKGEIQFNGWIHEIVDSALMCSYTNGFVIHRNGVLVDGGELIFNGGRLVGGRSKREWVTAALRDTNMNDSWNWGNGLTDIPHDKLYTGYIRSQINCDGITVAGGRAVINGGVVEGRGFRVLEAVDKGNYRFEFNMKRAAAIYVRPGGSLVINDGEIWGMGGANVLDIAAAAEDSVVIRAGLFEVHKIEQCAVPRPVLLVPDNLTTGLGDWNWTEYRAWYTMAGYGRIGIPQSALNPDDVTVSIFDWEHVDSASFPVNMSAVIKTLEAGDLGSLRDTTNTVFVIPKTDIHIDPVVRFESGETATVSELERKIIWDGKSNVTLTADVPKYWPDDPLVYQTLEENFVYHSSGGMFAIAKDLGVMPSVTLSSGGSMTQVTQGGGMENVVAEGYLYLVPWDPASDTFGLHVSLPSLFATLDEAPKVGDKFLVRLNLTENIFQYGTGVKQAGKNHGYTADIYVYIKDLDITVTRQPASDLTHEKGAAVTLTAAAEGAKGAYWKRVAPVAEVLSDADCPMTFDAATGEATLEVKVDNRDEYVCVFTNGSNSEETARATVGVTPEIDSTDRNVTWYTGKIPSYLVPQGDFRQVDQNLRSVQWYFTPAGATEEIALTEGYELASGSRYTFKYSGDLCVSKPSMDCEGTYRAEYVYELGSETLTLQTGRISVTVVDAEGPAAEPIESAAVYGLTGLNVGDQAPGKEELWVDDSRIEITDVTWNAGVNADGTIISPNPMVSITLRGTVFDGGAPRYPFKWSTEGGKHFPWTMDGASRSQDAPSDLTTDSSATVTLTYTWDAVHALSTPQDALELANAEFTVMTGETVDYVLDYTFTCHAKHDVTHHVTGLTAEGGTGKLPDGLSLVQESDGWHVKGTVTQESADDPVKSVIEFATEDDGGNAGRTQYAVLAFHIKPPATGFGPLPDEATLKSMLYHEHQYGSYTDNGDGTHTRVCSLCGNEDQHMHNWDEGVVTAEPSLSADGVMTYTCIYCGAEKTETLEKLSLTAVELADPTTTEKGRKAYWYAAGTGLFFEDAAGTKQVTDPETLDIPMVTYEVTKGADGSYEVSSRAGTYDLTVNRSWKDETTFDHFTALLMDGKEIAPGNYEARSGSLNAAVNAAYMATLTEGEHTLTVRFDDADVTTKITVTIARESDSPRTGRDARYGLYLMLMGLSLAGIGAVLYAPGRKRK